MASVVVNGDTSGAVTLSAPAVAGTVTVTLPSTSGVMAVGGGTITTLTTTSDITVQGVTVGRGAGAVATNTAVGASALAANTSGGFNTAVGYQAGSSNTTGGAAITAFGYQAGKANTSGFVSAFGFVALAANTSGANNAAFGAVTLAGNTTGSFNTGIGDNALQANTTASNNTAVGYQAGYINTTGATNCFFGNQAGYTANSSSNTFIGPYAGYYVSSGAKNTVLGGYNGNQGGLDIRTASNYIVLSDGDGNPRMNCASSGTWTINAGGSGVNNPATLLAFYGGGAATTAGPLRFGDGSFSGGSTNYWDIGRDNNTTGNFTFTLNGTQKGYIATATGVYTAVSDRRSKKNIASLPYGLSSVMAMNPVMYHMVEELDTDKKHIGLIAQEIKAVIDESVDDIKDEATQFYGLDKSGLVPVLIKAIQELKAEVDSLKAQINGASA